MRRRTVADRLEDWTESQAGIGAGFEVDRDALLLFCSPETVNQATLQDVDDVDLRNATRSIRLLRALVETPAVLYADLDDRDAEELRTTRGLRITEANHMVGGHVETRREGMVMLIDDDAVQCPVVAEWPTAAAGSWLSLVIADLAGRVDQREPEPETGVVMLTRADIDDVVTDFLEWRESLFPQAFRNNADAVRIEAERQLCHLGLLRLDGRGGWLLLPVAGRYRDADVILPDAPPTDHGTDPDAGPDADPLHQPALQATQP